MKIALNSYTGIGSYFALRLMAEGHQVDYYLSDPKYVKILDGIVPRAKLLNLDHRQTQLNYTKDIPDYSKYDLSIFDITGRKRLAETSRLQTPTLGDGHFHCILENNREDGMRLMEQVGIKVPAWEKFINVNDAKAFIRKTGRRYIFKPDTEDKEEQNPETTYVSHDADDMLDFIDKLSVESKGVPFILQEYVKGLEISTEGWFCGSEFHCLNCTLEEKKFMNENVGPATGCAGNLVFTINENARIFKEGLAKTAPALSAMNFCGPLDLNSIVTEDGLYGLEFTPRFGYDAFHTFLNMYAGGAGHLLHSIANSSRPENSWKAEFSAGVRISIPPYPSEVRMRKEEGVPIKGLNLQDEDQVLKTFMYDVKMNGTGLASAGICGFLLVPVETGSSIPEAFSKLKESVRRLQIPDAQYRTDIEKKVSTRYYELLNKNWI